MIELLYLIFLMLTSLALGQKILRLMGINLNYAENLVFALPLGLAVLAYFTFFIGIIGFLYKSVLMLFLFILFVLFFKDIKAILQRLFTLIKNIDSKKITKKYGIGLNFYTIVIVFLLLLVVLNFIASFVPPWHFDVLAYHLAVPKIYTQAHQIIYVPYIFYSNLPSLVDTMYLMGLLLHSGILSNLIGYSLGAVFVFAIFLFCKRFFNLKIALLAPLIFYSMPNIIRSSRTSHVDLQFALFIFLSFYALFLYFSSNSKKHLILSAVFAGFGLSSKVFGIIAVAGISVVLAYHLISRWAKKNINFKDAFLSLFIFGLIVLIIFLPWLLKNYFFTGNPVWPIFNDFFNGKNWDKSHQENLAQMTLKRTPSLVNFLRLPWDIHTQTGSRLPIENIDYEEGIGPYFLVFLPLYFFLSRKNNIINIFFIMILIFISIWFFMSYSLRYIIFSWPLIAIISAYVIVELFRNKNLAKVVQVLLTFTLIFNLAIWAATNLKGLPVVFGLQSHDEFLSRYPGSVYKASKFVNENLPLNSKILLFRDNRGFYLDRDYVWADPLFQTYIDYSKIRNEDDYYSVLKSIGVTHVIVNTEFEWRRQIVFEHRYSERILGMMDKFLKKYTKNLYNKDGILINELE